MLNTNLLLHLTLIEDVGAGIIQKIMQTQRSGVQTSDLYHLSASDWVQFFGITHNAAQKIAIGLSDMAVLEKELTLIEQHKIQLVTFLDESYPQLLKEIHLPPAVLYFWGARENFSDKITAKRLAIVGSRKATDYGQRIIDAVVPDLVAAGYTIVSGGALGIDTMAHEAALRSGGKTIVILGSGLLRLYPSQNKMLFKKIVESGGIVATPYPVTMEGLPHNFPARNRIVTGLSQGCLVVQAAKKSGALISAHCALEQGREVFAVPGLFDDELSAGCHEIMQQGAKLVMSSADILTEFGDRIVLPDKQATEHKAMQLNLETAVVAAKKKDLVVEVNYSETQQKILRACKNASSLEDIIGATQLSCEQVQAELFNLQLDGVISQDFTGMWVTQL